MRARLRGYVARRPVLSCVLLALALAAFLVVRHRLFGGRVTFTSAIAGELGLLALTLLLVGLLGWWRRAGVLGRVRWGWTAAALGGAAAYYLTLASPAFFVYRVMAAGFLLAALVGAAEELLCRGVVLEALRPLGLLWAGAGSAVFFGALHLNNLLLSPTPGVVAQAAYAVLLGLFLAAARLRLESIWPVVLVHAAIDLPGLSTGRFLPPPLPNAWLTLIPVLVSLPWGAAGIGMLVWDELHRP